MREYLSIGQIINTHGVKGEVKVYPLTDDIRRFRKIETVYIDKVERKIVWCKLQTDKVILKIEGIDSIEEGLQYKNKYIEVPRENAVKLSEGSYFVADIIGCTVFDENKVKIGCISDVIQGKGNDVYWIKGEKNILIPALKTVVLSVDIDNRRIIIKPLSEWNED